jgi:hypothetical protein
MVQKDTRELRRGKGVDGRDKPGHDGCGAPSRPSKQKTPLRHRLLLRRLADQKLAVGLHIVSLGVDLDLRRRDPLRIMLDFRGGAERVSAGASRAKVAQYLDKIRNARYRVSQYPHQTRAKGERSAEKRGKKIYLNRA